MWKRGIQPSNRLEHNAVPWNLGGIRVKPSNIGQSDHQKGLTLRYHQTWPAGKTYMLSFFYLFLFSKPPYITPDASRYSWRLEGRDMTWWNFWNDPSNENLNSKNQTPVHFWPQGGCVCWLDDHTIGCSQFWALCELHWGHGTRIFILRRMSFSLSRDRLGESPSPTDLPGSRHDGERCMFARPQFLVVTVYVYNCLYLYV